MALCQGQFSRAADAPLAHSTVGDTLNLVAATFRDNGRDDPKQEAENKIARLLRRQLRLYSKDDPKELQQKALPICVLRLILASKSTEMRTAMGHRLAAAHYWAMRSCENLKVPKLEQQQTKQLCLRNIAFIKDGKTLDHSSTNLNSADCIAITFEQQKNKRKANTVTQWKTNDVSLCPVIIWTSIITRIRSYKGTNPNSPVFLAKYGKKIISITSEMIVSLICNGVVAIGECNLESTNPKSDRNLSGQEQPWQCIWQALLSSRSCSSDAGQAQHSSNKYGSKCRSSRTGSHQR